MIELKKQAVEITAWTPRSEKHGDEWVPAGDLKVKFRASNRVLDQFDAKLRKMFYRKPSITGKGQTEIPGAEMSDTPARQTDVVERVPLNYEIPGYRLRIHEGLLGELLEVGDVTVDKVEASLFEGGTVELALRLRLTHVEASDSGLLHMLLRESRDIDLTPPEVDPRTADEGDLA